jgi:hypothetical protein
MSNEIGTGIPKRSAYENVSDRYTDGTGAWLPDCSNSVIHENAM